MKRLLKKLLAVALCAALVGGTAVTLPAVLPDSGIVASAALNYNNFQYTTLGGKSTIVGYTGSDTELTIPAKIKDRFPVISIYSVSHCTSLTKVNIGDGVTTIERNAFSGCTGLTSINIDENNPNYTSVDGVVYNKDVSELIICPNGKTSITIPDTVTSIGYGAFEGCTKLTTITIPDSVKSLGDYAFHGCTGLTSITIPDGVTSIEGAFYGCSGLTSVTIPDSVTNIRSAFSDCTGLTSVTIPDSVTSIYHTFSDCTGLTSVTIPDSVTDIAYAFSGCTGLRSITIPDSVTSIGWGAFSGCSSLTSITIPSSVTSIGDGAFYGCSSLTSITIPDSVTYIGSDAFNGCTELNIFGTKGSEAEQYANANGINFIELFTAVEGKEPTCTLEGKKKYYHCNFDNKDYEENKMEKEITDLESWIVIPATGHSFALVSHTDPTCTEAGENAYKCSVCGETKTETLNPTGHSYKEEVVKPTCTEQGYTVHTCEKCGDTYKDSYTEPTGHSYKEEVVKPTCTEEGYTVHTCEKCGDTYKDSYTEPTGHSYKEEVVKPTCTGHGYTLHTCENCGDSCKDTYTGATGHSFALVSQKAPTCTEEGEKVYKCSACGETKTEKIKAIGHNYKEEVVAPTCTEKGYTLHTCENCGDTYKDNYKDATGHNFEFVSQKAPTCDEDGEKVYKCSVCGEIKTEKIPATGHSYEFVSQTDPTCDKDGEKLYKCSVCGETKTEKIPATGHSYKDEVVAPTCTEQGYTLHTCEKCGDSYKDNYTDATGHSYKVQVVKPTCTEQGYTLHTCEKCGDSYKDKIVNATGHAYDLISQKDPTCTEEGEKVYKCIVCDDVLTEKIPATGHSYKEQVIEPTCTEQGYTLHTCEICGDTYKDNYTEAAGHSYKTKVVAPTAAEQGYTLHTCEVCGDSYKDNYVDVLNNTSTISAANVMIGTEVTLNGKATGGTNPYKFAYYYKKATDSAWTRVYTTPAGNAYTKIAEMTFKPTTAGTYNIRINVKDNNGTGILATKEFTVKVAGEKLKNNSTVSATSITAGGEITLNGKAEGGTSPYKFAYYYKKLTDSAWTRVYTTPAGYAYTKNAEMTFKPTTAGTYNIRINVKDDNGTGTMVSKEFTITVKADASDVLTNNSTVSATNVTAGTEVTMTGKATGGTSPYKYAYYYKKSTESTWTKAYVTSSGSAYTKYDSKTFTPKTAGTYDVRINVRDEYGNGKTVTKDFKITVK